MVLVGAEVMMKAFSAIVAVRVASTGASIRVDMAALLLRVMVDRARATTVEVLHAGHRREMEEAAAEVMLTALESRARMSREGDIGVLMRTIAPAGRSSCRMMATGAVMSTRVALGVLSVRVERVVATMSTVPALSA